MFFLFRKTEYNRNKSVRPIFWSYIITHLPSYF